MIKVSELSCSYGRMPVLRGVSFEHGAGVLCLLGPNGVGKSTLFRCILGLEHGYSGDILIDGKQAKSLGAKEMATRCAYVPQSQTARTGLSVLEMVMMGASAGFGLFPPGKAQKAAALQSLSRIGIEHLANRDYGKISGGERQLTLIARALAQGGKILVLDEPTANLDFGHQQRVLGQIQSLANDGMSIVLSTHHPDQALRHADMALALFEGEVAAMGKPEDVIDAALIERLYQVRVNMERTNAGHIVTVPV